MVKSHRILKFLFSTTLSGSCSYQSLALLNPSVSQNRQDLPTLSCLRLYSFSARLPYSLTIGDIVSFLVPHILQRGNSAVLSILYLNSLYRLLLGTTYQSLSASFQITFSHPSPCVVLIIVLHISSKLSMHSFCSPFIFSSFFFNFPEFFRVNCFPRVL